MYRAKAAQFEAQSDLSNTTEEPAPREGLVRFDAQVGNSSTILQAKAAPKHHCTYCRKYHSGVCPLSNTAQPPAEAVQPPSNTWVVALCQRVVSCALESDLLTNQSEIFDVPVSGPWSFAEVQECRDRDNFDTEMQRIADMPPGAQREAAEKAQFKRLNKNDWEARCEWSAVRSPTGVGWIRVMMPSGRPLFLQHSDTSLETAFQCVADLCVEISVQTSIPMCDQGIRFAGRRCHLRESLSELGIGTGSTVQLVANIVKP